ncbi:TPR end-of-group domain-containing protein [Engelhardtia mirabilis]|uniref:Uncharacterized protein n=1 Tax=Engelhardtia mirabilis TaxID=2528011 RepID=A0A518BJL2_9BACT|nr:hypothetical protein Pla133_22440 [Planctomycetes bacterium Pla133]QDV01493.1 hypothetical protein Pla86_22440 [Planctomycetes bacterium Pla86]
MDPDKPQPMELPDSLRERLDAYGDEFVADFLGRYVDRAPDPDNVEVLIELGHLLTKLGRYEQGLVVDQRLADLLPDEPTVHYNLACSLALTGARDEALATLEHCLEIGYDDADFMLADDDLACLRDDPRFRNLVDRLRA